ncbi:hypothetical protein FRB91_010880 [Serendipita sp. 411]|nr:hypothetical protein FRB91_010880 [Serendipita sp. 411]
MPIFSLSKSFFRRTKEPKKDFPTLPDELWILILTAALEPALILDEYCLSSNMEQFYFATTSPESKYTANAASASAQQMRCTLCLVCRWFNNIMNSIPKKEDHIWLRIGNGELTRRGTPVLRRSSGATDSQNTTYGRLDIELTTQNALNMVVPCTAPVSTYRLFVTSGRNGGTAYFHNISSMFPSLHTLQVIHLGLERCAPSSGIQYATNMLRTLFSGLRTLSLSLGANGARDILYLHFTLPQLRNLFLKHPGVDLGEHALGGWVLPSLTIFSHHSVIVTYRGRQNAIPRFISVFLSKYGAQLSGVRLVPGPWGSYKSTVIPMEVDQMCELWDLFSDLKALSIDLSRLTEYIKPLTVKAREAVCTVFSSLEHLTHIETGLLSGGSFDGIQRALSLCGPKLKSITIVRDDGKELDSLRVSLSLQSHRLKTLVEQCASMSVKLLDAHGKPVTMATFGLSS